MTLDALTAIALAAVVLGASLALLAALVSLARTTRPSPPVEARVRVVIPVTGRGVDLGRLIAALAAQSLQPERLVLVVESERDPAFGRLGPALSGSELPASLFVAGEAVSSTQKSHNLSRAIATHDDGAAIMVLADADIVPQPGWLADLVRPVARGAAQIVSGYRWALPLDSHPATLLVAWIDRAIGSIPKMPWQKLAWAGSLAFAPGVLSHLGAAELLATAISDDLALAAAADRAGLKVLYRMRVLVPSPVRHTFASMMGFATRQYQMLMLYQPWIWATALATVMASLALRSGLWAAALVSGFWLKILAGFILANWSAYGLRLWRAHRLDCWQVGSWRVEALLFFVPLLGPVIDLIHLIALLKGARTSRIDWSHLSYDVKDGQVIAIERRPWA